eukprot:scaffold111249_cov29-Prasinocladus_malaysianus.AAC.1
MTHNASSPPAADTVYATRMLKGSSYNPQQLEKIKGRWACCSGDMYTWQALPSRGQFRPGVDSGRSLLGAVLCLLSAHSKGFLGDVG